MTAVNLFIGGTGVNLAVFVKSYAAFYRFKESPAVYAIDTDTAQQLVAKRQLQNSLVLAYPDFLERLTRAAETVQREPYDTLFGSDRRSFGDAVLHAGAAVVKENFQATGGLFTLRAAGWLAFEDINQHNLLFVPNIVNALGAAKARASQDTPVLNVIASIAGGTGSGLFIPLIAAIRAETRFPIEVNLHVVTPSAFHNNWLHADEREILQTRGESGAYAAYREIMAISDYAEVYSEPEERSVLGLTYHTPRQAHLIQKVFWWGRRQGDAESRADDVFYEAGRFVTLLNDANVYPMFVGAQGTANNRRVVGIATIEYPRLERSRAIAGAAIEHLAKEIAHGSEPGSRANILAKAERHGIALIGFIRSQRAANMPLGSPTVAASKRVDATVIEGKILDQLKVVSDGKPTEILRNSIKLAGRGDAIRFPNYAGSDQEWQEYLVGLMGGLEQEEQRTLREMKKYLDWMREQTISRVAEAAAESLEEIRTSADQPSIPDARRMLLDLVEDLDIARLFFDRAMEDAILRDPPVSGVDPQRNEVLGLRERLANMVSSNPDFKPRPPAGFIYHPFLQGVAATLSVSFLAMAFFSGAPLIGGLYDLLVRQVFDPLGQTLDSRSLLVAAALAFVIFVVLNRLRAANFTEEPELRKEAEGELVAAWDELVTAQMLDLFWKSSAETCRVLVGSVPSEQVGQRREAAAGTLAPLFALLQNGADWLDELAENAAVRQKELRQERPGWVRTIGRLPDLSAYELRKVIPLLHLRPTVTPEAGVSKITDLDLARSVEDSARNIPFAAWKRSELRTEKEKEQHRVRLETFYLDLEAAVLPKVSEANLLPADLREALLEDKLISGSGDTATQEQVRGLAQAIDELIRQGKEIRGVSADLTRPLPQSPTPYLFAPANAFKFVTAAMEIMRRDRFEHASYLPDRAVETDNIGQAIAFVQAATFGAEDEPEADAAKLRDIEWTARATYYGVKHAPSGKPKVTKEYSARNTEFHLLPEFSTAARFETIAGRDRPIAPTVADRLYGSHHLVSGYPSMIELFYIAQATGHLVTSEIAQPRPAPALLRWSLKLDGARVPLVQWPNFGGPPPGDLFGKARKTIALFDAFRVCMTKKATIGVPPQLSQPDKAEILARGWAEAGAAETIIAVRDLLIAQWQGLRGAANVAQRERTYEEMWSLAEADATDMQTQIGVDWRLVTRLAFEHGKRDLSGALSLDVVAPEGVRAETN